jgi:membrane-bound lytic murein transglycosylase
VNVEFDRQYRRSIAKVRPLGTFILEVQGSADVQLPQVRKL